MTTPIMNNGKTKMTKDDAIKWAGSVGDLAERLGISSSAVSQWPPKVPELQQHRLVLLSANRLVLDDDLLPQGESHDVT
jgi:DNA-binding transcriptional regulator YdaS (Cro superfamily)